VEQKLLCYGRLLLILTVCLILASPLVVNATAIVALRTPEAIGIAADSLVTVKGGSIPAQNKAKCKIMEEGGVIFTLAGFAADPDRSFDLRHVIASALSEEKTGAPAKQVADAASRALKTELDELRASAPALLERFISIRRRELARVLLASFSENIPRMEVLSFTVVEKNGQSLIEVSRQSCPGNCNPEKINAAYLADGRPIEKALASEKIPENKPEQAAEILVRRVIEAGTPGVEPPVDVVRIDRSGISWIARKPICVDVQDGENLDPPLRTR